MPAPGDLVGTVVAGRYEILEQVGEGGFATVWKANQLQPEGVVALKVLKPEHARDPGLVKDFLREAGLYVPFRDEPHIATILECGKDEENDLYFLVMTFLDGTVDDLLEEGPLPPDQCFRIAEDVGAALAVVHKAGLVHRDIKCSNIMLVPGKERFVLTDFGIGLVQEVAERTAPTREVEQAGTWSYASPEQIRARKQEEIGPSSDIYSLGVALFRAATGEFPFPPYFPQVIQDHLETEPPDPRSLRPEIPIGLAELILRAMRKDPAERFASAEEFLQAARKARTVVGVPASDKKVSLPKLPPVAWAAGAVGLLALIAVIAVFALRGGGAVMVESDPPGAHFRIFQGEGSTRFAQPVAEGATPGEIGLAAGTYTVEMEKEGYFASKEVIQLGGEGGLPPFELEKKHFLRVESEPPGARILLARIEEEPVPLPDGITPVEYRELRDGPHEIRLVLDGYKPLVDTIVAGEGAPLYTGVLQSASEVTLQIRSEPAGAEVTIDGIAVSMATPCEVPGIAAGMHRISFRAEGFQPLDTTLVLQADEPISLVDAVLAPAGEPRLVIESRPAGARIFLNGKEMEQKTPATFTRFPSGEVEVRLEMTCRRPYRETLSIPAQGRRIEARLDAVPPQTFLVNTVPGYAEIYVDDNIQTPVNRAGTAPWEIKLSCGKHTFKLINVDVSPAVDVTMSYTVRPGAPARSLILDWRKKQVVEN